MSLQPDLYEAILARRSVRRYDGEPLDEAALAQVREIISGVKPLLPENQFEVFVRDDATSENLVEVLGGYGRFVTPPHYLAAYGLGEDHVLEDQGYRVQQIAVRLAALGIGSCYIGALSREDEVRVRFGLPKDARIGAFLVFGLPSPTLGGRAFNRLMRLAAGASNKLPPERIFFQDTFDSQATPPSELSPLIEAARHAPSAVNAQPWRFLWRHGRLYLFVTRRNRKYGSGPSEQYRFYDGGICMANVALALEALGMEGQWTTLEGSETDIPEHPTDLQPLAKLTMRED
jgi:nitroreductase